MALPAHVLRRLSAFSACEISDALLKLNPAKYPHGGLMPDINLIASGSKKQICGQAFTVQMALQSDKAAPKLSDPFASLVDLATEGSVIVVSVPRSAQNASWGGLMTARAKAKGVLGVIVDGRCRDLAEHREQDFPVFARGHSTLGQNPFIKASQVQSELTIHPSESTDFPPVRIKPDAVVLADEDGVVSFEPSDVEQVLDIAAKSKEIDAKCMADLQNGRTIKDTFKEHRGK